MNDNFLDFEVDKLTNSIENTITSEVFGTEIVEVTSKEQKLIDKSVWLFDWRLEIEDSKRQVFKLTTIHNSAIIQGLVCLEDRKDHISFQRAANVY